MYRIAVCEDEDTQRAELCALCGELLTGMGTPHEILPFTTAEELEAALTGGAWFDLLCLDIHLPGKSGMELALEVRERDDHTGILFVTGSTEFLLEGYKTRPIRYLLKPVKREELAEALQAALRLRRRPRAAAVTAKGKIFAVSWEDIRYVRSKNHICIFYTAEGERRFPLSLTRAEAQLPAGRFCRCHNSYLVNLAQIGEVTNRAVILRDGGQLPIGRRYAEQFRAEFVRHLNQ